MGLLYDSLEFSADPPTCDELRAHLREQMGGDGGLDSYTIDGRRAELLCMMDPVTRPYALAFLFQKGGWRVDPKTGERRETQMPAFVEKRWRDHSWWTGLMIRFGGGSS